MKRGEVLQGQAHKNNAAAFAFGLPSLPMTTVTSIWQLDLATWSGKTGQAIMAKSHTNAVRFRTFEIEKKSTRHLRRSKSAHINRGCPLETDSIRAGFINTRFVSFLSPTAAVPRLSAYNFRFSHALE